MRWLISKNELINFINVLSTEYNVYCLTKDRNYLLFSEEFSNDLDIDGIRAITPIKSFYLAHREELELKQVAKLNIIFGVKNCDLQAKVVLDKMFLEGAYIDPIYKLHNENTIIFASDCPEPGSSCWCNIVGRRPYPEVNFDLNFSPVEDGYIVESGSKRGEDILSRSQAFLEEVTEEKIIERENMRNRSMEKLSEINKEYDPLRNINFQELMKASFESGLWKEISKDCVQCLGCSNICPSCYCFYLIDKSTQEGFKKVRYWDACQYTSYARVAAGLNPRPKVFERFRNRYQCKFNYRFTNFGVYACTGCGRCIDVAPCKIDIRKVLMDLKNESKSVFAG